MLLLIIKMVIGLVGLSLASDRGVEAIKRVAKKFHVSDIIIGLTLASLGTSLPEIFTNISAALSINRGMDASGIAVGNIIGSCLSQITIILGIVALFGIVKADRRTLLRDGSMMLVAALAMYFMAMTGKSIDRVEGASLILLYLGYMVWVVTVEKNREQSLDREPLDRSVVGDIAGSLFWIAVVIGTADLVVDSGITIAEFLEVPVLVIGLLIGLGTSLPELAISVSAIRKGDMGISLGNLIGSNITDPLFSLGAGAVVSHKGFAVSQISLDYDFPIWIGLSLLTLGIFAVWKQVDTKRGMVLIGSYVGYLLFTFSLH